MGNLMGKEHFGKVGMDGRMIVRKYVMSLNELT
jgi:hypothetical protein